MMFALMAAFAQDAATLDLPIDVERFKPVSDTYGYVLTESSTSLRHLQVGVGMWGNYSEDSLVLLRSGARVIGPPPEFPDAILNQRSMVDFQFGLGIGDLVAVSVDLPIVLWQEGFEPTLPGDEEPTRDLVSSGIGDIRLTPKFVVLDIDEGRPIGISLSTGITFPTGSRRSFIGEGGVTVSPLLAVELADGSIRKREYHIRVALNAGARTKEPDNFRGLALGPEFLFRAGIAGHPAPAIEIGVDLAGAVAGPTNAQIPVELVPFLRILPVENAALIAGAGFGLVEGVGSPDLRVFLGGTLAPRFDPLSRDRDHDGIPNKYDACISIPEDRDGFEDEDGCPDPDNDGDGILDEVDRCPNDPEDLDRFQDEDGCPDPDNDGDGILDTTDRCPFDPEDFDGFQDLDGCPDPDNDGDGIPDTVDACPNAAETFNGVDDTDGCPDEKPHVDTDGDGYLDDVDRCPFDPEDFDTWQDEDGCPDPDNDLDGIYDTSDSCPFDPETRNGYQDQDGCPDEVPGRVVVQQNKIEILDRIYFEVDKAVIDARSFELLDEVAQVIVDNPYITRIRVEGHTDSDGGDAYNLRLSQARAEAVVRYLGGRSVASDRLEAAGFGETRPVDSNKTSDGKQNNRRVEFVIVEKDR